MRRLSKNYTRNHELSSEISSVDELDYLVDMLAQLKIMAENAETSTLARLLEVAHHEAQLQLRLHQQ